VTDGFGNAIAGPPSHRIDPVDQGHAVELGQASFGAVFSAFFASLCTVVPQPRPFSLRSWLCVTNSASSIAR
jgi:hypothetical protein